MEEKKANVRLEALRIYYGWKLRHDFRRPIRFGLQKKNATIWNMGHWVSIFLRRRVSINVKYYFKLLWVLISKLILYIFWEGRKGLTFLIYSIIITRFF